MMNAKQEPVSLLSPSELPLLYEVAGAELYGKVVQSLGPWHLNRVEKDLAQLQRLLSAEQMRCHYVVPLVNDKVGAVAELFLVARASLNADTLVPHSPGRGKKNFDALIVFGDCPVAIEVKHQRDAFPFNAPPEEINGIRLYQGLRPTVDPRFVDLEPPRGATQKVPGADIWRQTTLEAATQLPRNIPTIVAVSVDAFGGFEDDVVAALIGDEQTIARMWSDGTITFREERLENGVFEQESFRHVTAVWFFKLHPELDESVPQGYIDMCVWARGCLNSEAINPILPSLLVPSLPNVVGREQFITLD